VAARVALGLGGALPISRWMKALLFQVSTWDPLAFTIVPMILAVVARLQSSSRLAQESAWNPPWRCGKSERAKDQLQRS